MIPLPVFVTVKVCLMLSLMTLESIPIVTLLPPIVDVASELLTLATGVITLNAERNCETSAPLARAKFRNCSLSPTKLKLGRGVLGGFDEYHALLEPKFETQKVVADPVISTPVVQTESADANPADRQAMKTTPPREPTPARYTLTSILRFTGSNYASHQSTQGLSVPVIGRTYNDLVRVKVVALLVAAQSSCAVCNNNERALARPICAPKCWGSAAIDCKVSAVARNNKSYIWRLF
jgi:hypothetical protein